MLKDVQARFYDAIVRKTDAEFVASTDATERLNIYRISIQDNLRRALSITYPGIWKLLGEECANNVAYAFCSIEKNLPTSGCLDLWGEDFADFLAQIEPLQSLSYLQDFAKYEWLKHLAYSAPSQPAVGLTALQNVSEAEVESIQLNLLPSVYCMQSQYPLDEILNVIENPDADPINLNDKRTYAIIARPENEVVTFWVGPDSWHFINYIVHKSKLGKALEMTLDEHPHFDLPATLNFLLSEKLV